MARTSWSKRGARLVLAAFAIVALTVGTATADRVSGTPQAVTNARKPAGLEGDELVRWRRHGSNRSS